MLFTITTSLRGTTKPIHLLTTRIFLIISSDEDRETWKMCITQLVHMIIFLDISTDLHTNFKVKSMDSLGFILKRCFSARILHIVLPSVKGECATYYTDEGNVTNLSISHHGLVRRFGCTADMKFRSVCSATS